MGMRPQRKQLVNTFELPTYEVVISKALLIENDFNEVHDRDWNLNKKKSCFPITSCLNQNVASQFKRREI